MAEQSEERAALAAALNGHRIDTRNQDSGQHCVCGSDSRFEQRNGDHPWATIGEHLADMALRASTPATGSHARTSPATPSRGGTTTLRDRIETLVRANLSRYLTDTKNGPVAVANLICESQALRHFADQKTAQARDEGQRDGLQQALDVLAAFHTLSTESAAEEIRALANTPDGPPDPQTN